MKKFKEIKETAIDKLVEFKEKHPKASKVLKTVDVVLPVAAAFVIGIVTEKAIDDAKCGGVHQVFREPFKNANGDKLYVYGYTPTVRELKKNKLDGRITGDVVFSTHDNFEKRKELLDKKYNIKD